VIPGEDPDALGELAEEYYAQFRPQTPVARYLVDTLVQCDWNRRRPLRLQAGLFSSTAGDDPFDPGANGRGPALGPSAADRIFRQLNAMERHYARALGELRRLANEEPDPAAEPEIGFVPSIDATVGQAIRPPSPVTREAARGESAVPPPGDFHPAAARPAHEFGFVPPHAAHRKGNAGSKDQTSI
jgi:hypothetical protein